MTKAVCILFAALVLPSFQGWAQTPIETAEEDSIRTAPGDSARFYRPQKPKKQKSYDIRMTEYMVKSSLTRLSYYAQGRYLNSYRALDDMFLQINALPEEVKNKMFAYTLAGGLARQVFRQTRKQLCKRKLGFVYPSLYGLNFVAPLRPLKASLHFRTLTFKDRYYALSLRRGQLYLLYRQTPRYTQQACYVKVYKRLRLFGLRSNYQYTFYNGIGVSNYSKKLFLYFIFLQNPGRPKYNRITLFVNMDLN